MKLVLTLLVRDEEDIVAATVAHHLERGVDHVIVTDNGSVDGTVELLRPFVDDGAVTVLHEPADDYHQGRWVTRMARIAATELRADWVINADADELWWPLDGNLASTLAAIPAAIGIVPAMRIDFLPVADERSPIFERMVVREARSTNSLGQPLPAKVAHRASPEVVVVQGNHALEAPVLAPLVGPSPIVILHFPLRTYAQFERKVCNGGRAYRNNADLPTEIGETWRALYADWEAGRLPERYAAQVLTPARRDAGLAAGTLVLDRRASRSRRLAAAVPATPVPPAPGARSMLLPRPPVRVSPAPPVPSLGRRVRRVAGRARRRALGR